ncbi:hypothetical protein BASA50_001811 [Batrachochytrium salamandrivorans]|uniref:Uncharacterized protein n=1 Tax=Batrachochytrium salamandrivorans TaxID=1357716 RepID=A0ABQ8FR21_9FUNG|nr:hypothetical protein BASA62_009083 [Batrachochytrium salamandrivorans]KAH6585088.1 hypothetical protein BASA60_000683 [Batrachochytrium salamandrivorans]KAH6601133.1 hypothetical protein BASA50_001811 [Batrachochytrium salamandrivorans]
MDGDATSTTSPQSGPNLSGTHMQLNTSQQFLPAPDWAPMIIGVLGRISEQLGNIEQRLGSLEEQCAALVALPVYNLSHVERTTDADETSIVVQPSKKKRACATLSDDRTLGCVCEDPDSRRQLLFQLLLISTSQADPRAVGSVDPLVADTPLRKLCADAIRRIRKEISNSKLEGRLDTLFLEAANSNIVQHIVSSFDLPTSCMAPFKQYRANSLDTSAIGNFSCAFLARHFVWPVLLRWMEDSSLEDVLVSKFTREYGILFHKVYTAIKNSMRPVVASAVSTDDAVTPRVIDLIPETDSVDLVWSQQIVPVCDTTNSTPITMSSDQVSLTVIYHSSQQLYTLANMQALDIKSLALASAIAHSSDVNRVTPMLLVHRRNIKSCFFEFAARYLKGLKTYEDLALAVALVLELPPHGDSSLTDAYDLLEIECDPSGPKTSSIRDLFHQDLVRMLFDPSVESPSGTEYPVVSVGTGNDINDLDFVAFMHLLMVRLMTPDLDNVCPKGLTLWMKIRDALEIGDSMGEAPPRSQNTFGDISESSLINFPDPSTDSSVKGLLSSFQNEADAAVTVTAASATAVSTDARAPKRGRFAKASSSPSAVAVETGQSFPESKFRQRKAKKLDISANYVSSLSDNDNDVSMKVATAHRPGPTKLTTMDSISRRRQNRVTSEVGSKQDTVHRKATKRSKK